MTKLRTRKQVASLTLGFCVIVSLMPWLQAQQVASSSSSSTALPRLVRFSGTVKDVGGNPLAGTVGITFALYSEQTGSGALWMETQNVQADANGHYTALLGSTKPDGLPTDLFNSEQARWVGVQVSGQAEQSRVLLVSAPYALKAGDAETVGGFPASAFALAKTSQAKGESAGNSSASKNTLGQTLPAGNTAVTGKGTIGFVPMWDKSSDIVDSTIFQKSSDIGIGTKTPAATLDVSGTSDIRDTLTLFPKGTDSTLAISGTTFKIDQTGKVTFVAGQTFPGGSGTITGVTAGTDLTGGGTSGKVTLSLDLTKVPQLATANSFTGNQTVNGTVTATSPGNGVVGVTSSAAAFGVAGQSPNSGVVGVSSTTSKTGAGRGNAGVWGDTGAGADSGHAGVLGTADANTAGWFINNGPFATVIASNSAQAGQTNAFGVAAESNYVGVYGILSGASATGARNKPEAGVWGDTGLDLASTGFGVGIFATADNNPAGWFVNNSSAANFGTVFVENFTTSNPTVPVFTAFGEGFGGVCNIDVSGNLGCTGSVTAVAPVDGGTRRVALYAIEGPESWFEDIGSGQLTNGAARVELDSTFAQTVNTQLDYKVFLTPNGDCRGLYVTQKATTSFEVHELGGGNTNVTFDYRVVAKRRGYENLRLADETKRFNARESELKSLRHPTRPLASSNPGSPWTAKKLRARAQPR
jgi:hypothetical protein